MRVVGDQRGGPTAARDIAEALWTIAEAWGGGPRAAGHLPLRRRAGDELGRVRRRRSSRAQRLGAAAAGRRRSRRADWPTKAVRPANSVLDCAAIAAAYGIAQPDWRPALDAVIDELSEVDA